MSNNFEEFVLFKNGDKNNKIVKHYNEGMFHKKAHNQNYIYKEL